MNKLYYSLALAATALVFALGCSDGEKKRSILNVSYDPTRELYKEYDAAFAEHWLSTTGEAIEIEKCNGGSGAQARAVKMGHEADVVTLALAFDIDDVATDLFEKGSDNPENPNYWQKRLPNNSCPYVSTIVIVVRKGNPKNIRGWEDLTRPDVEVVTPNPKTSGGARWNYLALWGFALDKALADVGGLDALQDPAQAKRVEAAQAEARAFVKEVLANVRSGMPAGARGATDAFVKNKVGDAFIAWENEAILAKNYADGEIDIVVPEITVKAEPPVAVVDKIVDRRGTRQLAEAYLNYMYEPKAQDIIARAHYRPCLPEVAEKYRDKFPETRLFTVDDVFGGWLNAQRTHFNSDGVFDKIVEENLREGK